MLQPRNVLSFFAVLLVLTAGCGQSSERVVVDDTKPEVRTVILDETNSMLIAKAQSDLGRWYYAAAANEWQRAVDANEARERAEVERVRQSRDVSRTNQSARPGVSASAPISGEYDMSCGGDLPPCSRLKNESHGNIRIWNGGCYAPVGWLGKSPCGVSSASGKWQFLRGTWAGYGGCVNAADCPGDVQDERARQVWAGGRGCSNWDEC